MQFDTLPQLGDSVSKICLGTMTWGQQNSEQDAHEQMDYALAQGVNFWDTAEMYPSPPVKDKQGDTERFMGSWFAKTGKRNDVVLASKISRNDFLRGGNTKFDKKTIRAALDSNLQRLQTDHIDIYQLHWPERQTNFFGQRGYTESMAQQATQAYAEVAKKHHLDMAQMALAFVNSRSFVTANIIGATTIEQLASNIASVDLVLSQEVLADIEAVQTLYPNPAP
ncbi:hypothetical protein EN873_31845 [bacterium M00.F.Ca.ET.230.01.1.1]|nr:hypothetical protein EN873_31845 [bacterium M00.F.Ca.ET.230.01.1.1]